MFVQKERKRQPEKWIYFEERLSFAQKGNICLQTILHDVKDLHNKLTITNI